MNAACLLSLAFGLALFPVQGEESVAVELDPAKPLHDLSLTGCGPGFGFDGDLGERVFTDAEYYYVTNRDETFATFRSAGARVFRQVAALQRFQGRRAVALMGWQRHKRIGPKPSAEAMARVSWTEPKNIFEMYRRLGAKAILCLDMLAYDPETDDLTDDPEVAVRAITAFLQWIIDNGYKDLVIGFEMENESYYRDDPERYGERWRRVLPEMRRLWPDVKVGLPMPIYVARDPDLEAVRQRAKAEMNLSEARSKLLHTPEYVNNSFYREVVALGGEITNISHVVVHAYGAEPCWTASYTGIERIRAMFKAFPQVAGKKVWLTEWRERSVENLTCQRAFRSSLWKATFLLMLVAQPELDACALHNVVSHSGVVYQSNGQKWEQCWTKTCSARDKVRPPELSDTTGVGRRHLALGNAGAMFSVLNPAFDGRPLVLGYGADGGFMASATFYQQYYSHLRREGVPVKGDCAWTLAAAKDLSSVAIVAVNSRPTEAMVSVRVKGFLPGANGRLRMLRSTDPARLDEMEDPNRDRPWEIIEREVEITGPEMRLVLPRDAIASLVIHSRGLDAEGK